MCGGDDTLDLVAAGTLVLTNKGQYAFQHVRKPAQHGEAILNRGLLNLHVSLPLLLIFDRPSHCRANFQGVVQASLLLLLGEVMTSLP